MKQKEIIPAVKVNIEELDRVLTLDIELHYDRTDYRADYESAAETDIDLYDYRIVGHENSKAPITRAVIRSMMADDTLYNLLWEELSR